MKNPMIIEICNGESVACDVYSRLLQDRIIFVGDIEEEGDGSTDLIVSQLIYLASKSEDKEIQMYINSPGGMVSNFLAIYDTMRYIKCPIRTVCFGEASSAAALILAAGTKGMRAGLPNSKVMIHLPAGGVTGDTNQIEVYAKEIARIKNNIIRLLSKHTGNSENKIANDIKQDFYMTSYEAKEYGLIDFVVEDTKEL